MQIINSIGQALFTSFSMFWEILWPLILGFTLSGIVQALVSHQTMAKTLGCDGLMLAAVMVIRFIRTGGIPMLRMMNKPAHEMVHHEMS